MFRPWTAAAAALFVSLAAFWLLTDSVETQSTLTASSANVDGASLTITLSSAADASSTAVASDFSVSSGDSALEIDTTSVSGATIAVTLADAVGDTDCDSTAITVSYTKSGSSITASGTELSDFNELSVTNETDDAPAIESLATSADGGTVLVTFCEAIDDISFQWSDFRAFTLRVGGTATTVSDLATPSGTTGLLELRLGSSDAVKEGETVTLAYDQNDANEDFPLRDSNQGNKLVESWSARAVTNEVDNPPTLKSVTALYDIVTLTFSEALDEDSTPASGSFTIAGVQNAPEVDHVSISDTTVSLTLATILHNRNSPTYTISYSAPTQSPLRQSDGAHNVADFSSVQFQSSTPTSKPVVTSAEVDGVVMKIDFDLPLKNVADTAAFSIGGQSGVTVTDASYEGSVVTLTLSTAISVGATVTVSYVKPTSPPRIEGRNTVDADSFSSQSVTNHTVAAAPEFSSAAVSADGATLTITFSLSLDGSAESLPAASTFSLTGTTASVETVAIDGTTVALSLSPRADIDETILIGYAPPTDAMSGRLQSSAHAQAVEAFASQAVTNSADGKPRPISAAVNGDSLSISFDRDLDAASLPAASSFTLAGTTATVSERSIDAAQLTLTLSRAVTHTENITASYAAPMESQLKRDGTEIAVPSFTALAVTNKTPNPTPTFRSASIDATGQRLTIVMSHPLLSATAGTPAATTFTLSGSAQAVIESVSIDGTNVKLTLNPAADVNETIILSYQPPSDTAEPALQSTDEMWRTAAWTNQSVTNHADGKPRPVQATVDGSSLVLHFDRALDQSTTPRNADFSVTPAGTSVSNVAIDRTTATLTLSPAVEYGDTVAVSYSPTEPNALKRDSQEIFVDAFSAIAVENNTPEPLILSVSGDGTTIVISFSVTLDEDSTPDSSAFSLNLDNPSVSNVAISGMTVTLTLSESLVESEAYSLTYAAPATAPLVQSDSAAIPGFTKKVANETDVAPTVDTVVGNLGALAITFDQPLDSMGTVSASSFGLTGDIERTVSGVAISDSTLTLTLSSSLKEDEGASVTYTKPGMGGIADLTGHQAEDFSKAIDNQTDTAPIPVSGTVEDDTVVIILDQELYADPRFASLAVDSALYEHFMLTGTDAAISEIEISNDGPDGVGSIVLTLSKAAGEGDTILVTYQPSGSGNIPIRDNDDGENRAQINAYQLENLTATPPAIESATLDGSLLTVAFDSPLGTDSEPSASWFALTPNTLTIQSATIDGSSLKLGVEPSATEGDDFQLTYTAPAMGGLVGETGKAVTGLEEAVEVDNTTDYAPTVLQARAHATGQVVGASRVLLRFDQSIVAPDTIDSSWFAFEPELGVHSVSAGPESEQLIVELDDQQWIREDAIFSLNYDSGSSEGIKDSTGNEIIGFPISIQNDVDVAPLLESITVNRGVVRLEFDQLLDSDQVPPPNCEWLESEGLVKDGICELQPELYWFRVVDESDSEMTIESVRLDGSFVELTLSEPVNAGDVVRVVYQSQSAGNGQWNLIDEPRDPSLEPNQVAGIDPTEATNLTAAAATSAWFDRSRPTMIEVEFDGALPSSSSLSADPLEVMVDNSRAAVQEINTAGSALTAELTAAVPECSSLALSYAPADAVWLDAAGHAIEAFSFKLDNFIERSRQLTCVRSDRGGMVLNFTPSTTDEADVVLEWSLSVNGEERDISVEESDGVVHLVPVDAICLGDSVALTQSRSDQATDLTLTRTIDRAAPCAVSALAIGADLRVFFDQQLDSTLPMPNEFAIGVQSAVATVAGIDVKVLSLQLEPPGVGPEDGAILSYTGSSLSGGGLTVGRFSLPIAAQIEPPTLSSAFAFGTLIVLKFDQPLLARNVPASRFAPAGIGDDVKVSSVEIGGSSVYLHLSTSLPDEPDLFGLVYLARTSGGLAGATGSRVPDSVFLVHNYTETPPSVVETEVDSQEIVVTFDQRIEGADARPSDFVVYAGRRRIEISALEWSRSSVVISLAERVTSLDSVLLAYRPGEEDAIRDLSNLPLAEFESWARNRTDSPQHAGQIVKDARLRSSSGGTTFERELTRGFASSTGIRFTALPGEGRIGIAHRALLLSVNVGGLSSGPLVIHLSALKDAATALGHIEHVPTSCWEEGDSGHASAWWLGESDLDGVPTDHGVSLSISGLVDGGWTSTVCVLDLISGSWSFWRPDSDLFSPSLIVENITTPPLSWDLMPLAG